MSTAELVPPNHIIYVVDVDSAACQDIRRMLGCSHHVIAHSSLSEFFTSARLDTVGCLIVDEHPAHELASIAVRRLADQESTLATIPMSADADVRSVVSAFEAGCVGFLEKPIDGEQLPRLVETALQWSTKRWHQARRARPVVGKLGRLTPAELQVMQLMCEGFHVKRIASHLERSPNTIRAHRSAILRKLEMETDTQLVGSVLSLNR